MSNYSNIYPKNSSSPDDKYIRQNAKIQAFINTFQRELGLNNNDQMLNNAVNNLNKDISKYDMVQSLISKIENQSGFFTNKKDKYNKLLTIINDDFKDYNTRRNLNEVEIKQILQLRGGKSRKTRKANKRKSRKSRKANKRKSRKN